MNTRMLTKNIYQLTVLWNIDRVLLTLTFSLVLLGIFMPQQALKSAVFIISALASIAPYFLFAVGLAASIKATGVDNIVAKIFSGHAVKAIILASVFGALSPFCSCGVIPLIASLLAAGVPLAPVMAFWIASPIMDPEMFILTSVGISFEFALAKAVSAITMGLFAGFSVLALQRFGFMQVVLKPSLISGCNASCGQPQQFDVQLTFWRNQDRVNIFKKEFVATTTFLGKWLALAFLIESLMVAYIDPTWIQSYLGGDSLVVIPLAALIGMPSYLNGYAAIPLIGSLIDMGMSAGAAMAFMIAGAVSSIPAAIAVYALVRKSIFFFYLVIGLVGSSVIGLIFQLI